MSWENPPQFTDLINYSTTMKGIRFEFVWRFLQFYLFVTLLGNWNFHKRNVWSWIVKSKFFEPISMSFPIQKKTGDFFCNPPRGDSHHFVSCTNNSLTYAFKKTSVWSATWEYWQYIFCLPLLIKKLKDRIKGLAVRHAARPHSTHGWCYEENIVTYRQVVLGKLK